MLPVIIKGDVHGSIEAIAGALHKVTEENNEVKVNVLTELDRNIHTAIRFRFKGGCILHRPLALTPTFPTAYPPSVAETEATGGGSPNGV